MNDNQIKLLRILYHSGVQNTQKLAQSCKLENSTAAYQLCGIRDLGYVVSDTKNQRGGGFATWAITAAGRNFMYERIREELTTPYSSVALQLSAEREMHHRLQDRLAQAIEERTKLVDQLRAEKSINSELNGLVKDLRTKLSAATAVKPVSGRHYFAVIRQIQGSYTCKVVERFARESDALRTAETYAQTHNTETVSVCESKHIIQLEQVINVKAVAKPI